MQALCLVWIILTSVSRCWILSYLSAKLNNCAFFKILFPMSITTDLRKSALLTFFLMSSKSYLCCFVAMPRFRFEQVARAKFVVLYKAFLASLSHHLPPCFIMAEANTSLPSLPFSHQGCLHRDRLVYRHASEGKGEIALLFIPQLLHKIQQIPGPDCVEGFIS